MLFGTIAGAFALFGFFYERESEAFLNRLQANVSTAAAEHDEIFRSAERSQQLALEAFSKRLDIWAARSDVDSQFESTFSPSSDGTHRSHDRDFDGAITEDGRLVYGLGAFIAPDPAMSRGKKIQLLAAYDVVVAFGEASLFWADNFYYYTPESDLIIFAPNREDRLEYYRKLAPATFNFQDRQIGQHVKPENNPNRTIQCTGLENVLYDQTKLKLTSGCQTPLDLNGIHTGAFGVSFLLTGWLSEAISKPIEGKKPFIIQSDGEMIAHEALIDRSRGEAFAKQFAEDLQADKLIDLITDDQKASGTLYFEPWKAYISYSRISGPSWYYIAEVPRRQVREEAILDAFTSSLVGVGIGVFLIGSLAFALQRVISKPLELLTEDAERDIYHNQDSLFSGENRNDEIGVLARSFKERNKRYFKLLSELDERVKLRTAELAEAVTRAQQADQAKTTFLANMSHEIRTPLNAIVGMAQVLEKSNLPESESQHLATIQKASYSLLEVINDVLDLSKIESGSLEFETTSFSIEELVHNAIEPLRYKAHEKGLELNLTITAPPDWGVISDPTKIKQVLINFVSNSIKFTESGSIYVSIDCTQTDNEATMLTCEVSDTGIGMSQEQASKIFEPFLQADASTTRKYGGTGLGLAISKRIIEGLNGVISVDTEVNQGSRFKFSIPIQFDYAAVVKDQITSKPSFTPDLDSLTVLVAEDQETNRMVMNALLGPLVKKLILVENGVEAVEAWKHKEIDIILMDIQMPVLDGIDATKKIRSLEAAAGHHSVPIIALTANAFSEQVSHYLANGMNAHVSKPIDQQKLCETINECMRKKRKAA